MNFTKIGHYVRISKVKFLLVLFHPLFIITFFSFIILPCSLTRGPETCTKLRFDSAKNKTLFLTPYVKCRMFEKARQAAKVPMLDNIKSFSGFITVDKIDNRNLFFWYFPVENSSEVHTAPVLLWLQGGPGESSMKGLFEQHGPFYLENNGSLAKRTHRWCKNFHTLYIDSPVGSGFSFVNDKKYLENRDQAGADLYEALRQIFLIFPELGGNEFFIAGESYAGIFIPSLGRIIHRKNKFDSVKIHLKGLLIGNGMINPEFLTYGHYLAELNIIKTQDIPDLLEKEEQFKFALQQKNQQQARKIWYDILLKVVKTFGVNIYNYREKVPINTSREDTILKEFLSKKDVKSRLHVGNTDFRPFNGDVYLELFRGDFFTKISPYTEELLEHYRVLHYNGELDVVLHYQMTQKYADSLKWRGAEEYRSAGNRTWRVNGNVAGYIKSGGNLSVVVVKNAGHSVPKDRPGWALDLVTRFIRNQLLSC